MDVWDVASFPEPVIEALRAVDGAFVAHTLNVTQNRYEPDPTDEPRRLGLDVIARTMAGVTIRAWHYGRLCADEVELLMREGLWPTSQHRRNMRLRTRQDAGDLTSDDVASLTACCELNTDSFGVKDGAVFMTSTPRHPEEDYVCSLLASWGGEALARPRAGTPLGQRLALIGEPAVLEIALPFDLLPDWRRGLVVEAIEGGWLARQGCGVTENGRDLHVIEPLAPERILRVLRPCDHDFHTLGKSYPTAAVCLSPDGALRR
ncbi:MAG: hypothetical protein JHC96_02055 [Brevundimonas sp.]|uniref:hypothetical protein n=1 Tax=Brevundimonas sp. TaxID=1871086 RepID=UPI001A2A6F50|nr:hypothetical protein [Brevundimonas sp.]MBJ7317558.1 hypothetical protein [Brevundimonas sp.]